MEEIQDTMQGRTAGPQQYIDSSHLRLVKPLQCVEASQLRIEQQLQNVLSAQRRRQSPISSRSLDNSSPEGRETWMNLGRLMRDEGITPAMINDNRDVLIKAMKSVLREGIASNQSESYHTAFESISRSHNGPIPLRQGLSGTSSTSSSRRTYYTCQTSAPLLGATFTEDFLARHKEPSDCLDQPENVEEGMRTLLFGMCDDEDVEWKSEEVEETDIMY